MRRVALLLSLVVALTACVGAIAPEFFESKYGRCVSTGGRMSVGGAVVTQLSTTCYTTDAGFVKDAQFDPENPDDLQPPCACSADAGQEGE